MTLLCHEPCVNTECTLHQLSPYIGKLRSSAAATLIEKFTKPGDIVADPFCGSGTVLLEAVIGGRRAFGGDANPYARILTLGKLSAPPTLDSALDHVEQLLARVPEGSPPKLPQWVKTFFHPKTLQEAVVFAQNCQETESFFALSCLLGILHHQRPGFLSYPSSHLVPYLRDKKFPRSEFPGMYEYRELRTRLIKKVKRAYRRTSFPRDEFFNPLSFRAGSFLDTEPLPKIDCLITSPPYMNTLDYDRDNRLRLWFCAFEEPKVETLIRTKEQFSDSITKLGSEVSASLRAGGYAILVVGEKTHRSMKGHPSQTVVDIFAKVAPSLELLEEIEDEIPDVRRARRSLAGTKLEKVLIFKKA